MQRQTILVVEGDRSTRGGLGDALRFGGHEVFDCDDGAEALIIAKHERLDLVVLDRLPSDADGLRVLRELRGSHPRLPIILVAPRGAEEDRMRGLRIGADDCVTRPLGANELLGRVEAVLRRSVRRPAKPRTLRLGHRIVDFDRLEVTGPDGEPRALSELEIGILRQLAAHRGRPVGRTELLHCVWGFHSRRLLTRMVDIQIAHLRGKLEEDPAHPRFILTVRSKGYMLTDRAEGPS